MFASLVRSNPYGWIVVAVMFLVLSFAMLARSAIGLLMPTWEQELGWARTFVSGGGAVMLVVMAVGSPIAGLMLDRFGSRSMYVAALAVVAVSMLATAGMTERWHYILIYCVIGGIGFAAISAPMIATTVMLYFEENRGLATGVAASGATGGQLVLMPLLALGVTALGWRPSFVVLGLATLAIGALTFFVVRREAGGAGRPERGRGGDGLYGKCRMLASSRTFWLLFGGFFVCGFTTVGAIRVHLLPYAAACGFPPIESATAFGVLATFSMIGMIAYGSLSDRHHRPMLLASIYFLRAFCFILLMHVGDDLSVLFVFAVIFGIFDFSSFPVVASIVSTHIGLRVMGFTMGLLFAGHSLGGAAGSFLGGWLFDLFQRYDWVWIASFALAILAAFLSICIVERRGGDAPAVAQPATG